MNNTLLQNNSPHEYIARPYKFLAWKEILLSILGGYVCVVFFFIVAGCTKSDSLLDGYFFFSGGREQFSIKFWHAMTSFLLIAYTIYAVNKIIWFSLRNNGSFSAIYGSIRRFLETYVWCLYISFIPCYILDSFLHSVNFSSPSGFPFVLWDMEKMAFFVFGLYLFSVRFSLCLVALILVQRLAVTCYRTVMKKSIGKPENNIRFWQAAEISTPITFHSVAYHFISVAWELCYWLAMVVLCSLVFVCAVFVHTWLFRNQYPMNAIRGSFGSLLVLYDLIFVVICYLAFSTVVQKLFSTLWQSVRLCFTKKA